MIDNRWLIILSLQVTCGLALIFGAPEDGELGRLLLASAFGQVATGNLKATGRV